MDEVLAIDGVALTYKREVPVMRAYKEVCPDSDAWRFGCRSIPLFVYDMLFALRVHATLTAAYRRHSWAESET